MKSPGEIQSYRRSVVHRIKYHEKMLDVPQLEGIEQLRIYNTNSVREAKAELKAINKILDIIPLK